MYHSELKKYYSTFSLHACTHSKVQSSIPYSMLYNKLGIPLVPFLWRTLSVWKGSPPALLSHHSSARHSIRHELHRSQVSPKTIKRNHYQNYSLTSQPLFQSYVKNVYKSCILLTTTMICYLQNNVLSNSSANSKQRQLILQTT